MYYFLDPLSKRESCAGHRTKPLFLLRKMGSIIISPSLDNESKRLLQVDEFVRIEIEDEHKKYLKWHREEQLNF